MATITLQIVNVPASFGGLGGGLSWIDANRHQFPLGQVSALPGDRIPITTGSDWSLTGQFRIDPLPGAPSNLGVSSNVVTLQDGRVYQWNVGSGTVEDHTTPVASGTTTDSTTSTSSSAASSGAGSDQPSLFDQVRQQLTAWGIPAPFNHPVVAGVVGLVAWSKLFGRRGILR
jgi:hypothetical protein